MGKKFLPEKKKGSFMKKIIFIISIFFLTTSISFANTNKNDEKICSGFGKWTKDGEFKILRSNCITKKEYESNLKAKNYLCKYYQKAIWKESEREYGKKQYKWAVGSLEKIKKLKEEGKSLCDAGKLKDGEAKLKEAIKIISHTMMN